jgi:hypothetical protein
MKKKDILNEVLRLESKYSDLVWYARSSPKNYDIEGVLENIERIEKTYPGEVSEFRSAGHPDWTHGFNSGMLAGMRYILDLVDSGNVEDAEDEFPSLDT